MMKTFLILFCCLVVLMSAGCVVNTPADLADLVTIEKDAFYYNRLLGRGVNLGNALEAPQEGAWGVVLQADYFALIKEAGFDAVRIPVRWSAHAGKEPPYAISEGFFRRVDWAIEQAQSNGLTVVLNIHHYDDLMSRPKTHRDRFLALWQQIAHRYQDYPDTLYFELLNEPHDNLSGQVWYTYLADALAVIRETNPERIVIVGPTQWNNISRLEYLQLPEADRHIIVTFHYYDPFQFTHQGAEWVNGSEGWLDTAWQGTPEEKQAIIADFQKAVTWAEKEGRPLYLGEFGAYSKAAMDSRSRWTAFVRAEAERQGISWAYWEFGAGFGVYDRTARAWREALLTALVPPVE